jgi:1-acyl-sn-glycerol-3-phosphate acyltransferase
VIPQSETSERSPETVETDSTRGRLGSAGAFKVVPRRSLAELPAISDFRLGWFTWYCRGYLRRHFHSLRISVSGPAPDLPNLPAVLYANHASWWDPLVLLVLKSACFGARQAYAPIDAAMLARYGIFRRLGFFGVEQNSRRGAAGFLRVSERILESPRNLLVLTPQGRFADVRERPIRFAEGLGHLAARARHALFVPMALEYVFWEERLPEILVRFGEVIEVKSDSDQRRDSRVWTALLEERMAVTQDRLAREAQGRRPEDFQSVLRGGAGQGGIYDLWRGFQSLVRGRSFQKEHGNK